MQWLAALCVRRPVFTWVLVLSLVVVGGASTLGLGRDRFPNIDFPAVIVTTQLPGASPEQVETDVTDPIEEQLNSINGLDELRSNSYEGLSVISARFVLEKDSAVAAQEVRDRVNRVLATLPSETEQPRVERVDPDATPVMLIAVRSTRTTREVTEFARRTIRRQIESLPGVGSVTVLGGRDREIEVVADPAKLASFGLTARDLQRALATENVEAPGGNVEQGATSLQLRIVGRIGTPSDFAFIPIATRGERTVRVGDVAQVFDGAEDPSSAATLDGRSVVIVSVRKQSGTNTVAVVDALRERVGELTQTLPPSYSLEIVRDESEFIRNAVSAVQEHLVLGGLFAAIVVLLFLWNGRSTVIAALAIPSSIIATFALIAAMKLTLNTITLLALTLAVGIVIDDAIVVLENIVRFIEEKGLSPRKAAVEATKEIGLAVLATTLSLIAVFLPIAFMSGIVGRFMSSFGFTMSFAIAISLLVSFTLTPMLSSRWLKGPAKPRDRFFKPAETHEDDVYVDPAPGDRKEEKARFAQWRHGMPSDVAHVEGGHGGGRRGIYGMIERAYLRLLVFAMRNRWVVGIGLVITVFSLGPLMKTVAKNFLPVDDESRFEITVRAQEGTSLAQTQLIGERMAREVRALDGVAHTVLTVGSPPGDPSGRGPNQAALYVALVPSTQRQGSQLEIMTQVRERVIPSYTRMGLRVIVSMVNVFGGSGADAAAIQYVLSGPDLAHLDRYSASMLASTKKIKGVVDADVTLVTGSPAYSVQIDRARAADLGVSVADIANAMRLLVAGAEVTTYSEGGEQYTVRVRSNEGSRATPEAIARMTIPTRTGSSVRLADVASIARSTGPAFISHLGRQRQVTLYCNVAPGGSEAEIIQGIEAARAAVGMEPGYRGSLTGRSKELGRAGRGFLIALVLSLAFMYLVLAAQFESWVHPITILLSLPLTVPFAVFSLVVLGQSLNIFSMLGILVLFGVVKKNAILQVDHMRELRRKGLARADAIMIGNRDRLRPILMTTIAFVAGMIPLVASSGAGSGTNRAMGSVVIGGQTLSLLLTLIATPVIFTWFDDLVHSRLVARIKWALALPVRAVDGLFGGNKPTVVHADSDEDGDFADDEPTSRGNRPGADGSVQHPAE